MIREFVDRIVELARTETVRRVTENGLEIVYLDLTSRDLIRVPKLRDPESASLLDLNSFCTFLNEHGKDALECMKVFVRESGAETSSSSGKHAGECFEMPMVSNPLYKTLCSGIQGKPDQVARNLKFALNAAVSCVPETLVSSIGNLKFNSTSEESYTQAKNDEGVSKSLRSRVTGESELPEFFSVRLCMFPDFASQMSKPGSLDATISMNVVADPMRGIVELSPLPGHCRAAMLSAMNVIKEEIEKQVGELKNRVYLASS